MRLMLALALLPALPASDWPRFRGPEGAGVSPDRGLPAEIGREKNVLWSVAVPKGSSSPVVAGDRLFLTAFDGDERIALCYSAATGAELWRKSVTKARTEVFNTAHGPVTPTPATDGRRVFVFFPEFGLLAYDRDGKELWRRPLGPFPSVQGMAASPVFAAGRVVLLVDTPEEAWLASFDAATGRPVWKTEQPTGILGSYSTPVVWTPKGAPAQIVIAGAVELAGFHAATGERLWWARGVTSFPTGPPFVAGDSVYTVEPAGVMWPPFATPLGLFDANKDGRIELAEAAADLIWQRSLRGIDKTLGNSDGVVTPEEYGKTASSDAGGLVRTRLGGRGDVTATHIVWRFPKGMPALTGALLYDHVLYVVRAGVVSTFEPETGKLLRQERIRDALGEYYASPIAADGKIYLVNLDGKVTVLRAGAAWQVLSVADLGETVIATPAIAGGRLFFRTQTRLYSFAAKSPPRPASGR